METGDFLKLLGQGGITALLLFIVARLLHRIGERMIASIDAIRATVDEHTKADVAALVALAERIGRMEIALTHLSTTVKSKTRERLEQLEERIHRNTPVHGVPAVDYPEHVERERSSRVKAQRGALHKRGQWPQSPPDADGTDDE